MTGRCTRCHKEISRAHSWCDQCHALVMAEIRQREKLPCGCACFPNPRWSEITRSKDEQKLIDLLRDVQLAVGRLLTELAPLDEDRPSERERCQGLADDKWPDEDAFGSWSIIVREYENLGGMTL